MINEEVILKSNVILFDLFDTIVHRRYHPEKVKRLCAKELCQELDYLITIDELYNIRRQSEIYLENHNLQREYTYNQLADEIYDRIEYSYSINLKRNEFRELLLAIELKQEIKAIYLDEDTVKLIQNASRLGKHIFIVSDFYIGKEQLYDILNEFSIANFIEDIYVSCDYGKAKRTGDLYRVFIQETGFAPKDCLMIGDNKHSDCDMASACGLNVFYKSNTVDYVIEGKRDIQFKLSNILNSKKNCSDHILVLYMFIEKLYRQLKQRKQTRVYFLAREGEFLKAIFDRYLELKNDISIRTYYVYASRVATFTSSLKSLEEEKFENLFRQFPDMSIFTFLKNLCLEDEQIEEILNKIEFDSLKIINDFEYSDEFIYLKSNQCFIDIYNKHIKTQRDNFTLYLKSIGIVKDSVVNLVDVGWKGTMQDNIYNFFEGDIKIIGYYLGYNELGAVHKNSEKYGLVFSAIPIQSENYDLWTLDAGFWEKILYASHPSTKKYVMLDGKIKPLFDQFASENGIYNLVQPLQEQMMNKFLLIYRVLDDAGWEISSMESYVLLIFMKSVLNLNADKAKYHLSLESNHYENFGTFKSAKELYDKSKIQYLKKSGVERNWAEC